MEKQTIIKLDKTDEALLDALQRNAKVTNKELGEMIHKSPTAAFERVRQLEKDHVIEKYTIKVNKKKLGLLLTVYAVVQLKEHRNAYLVEFEKEVVNFPQVIECYHMTGNFDYMLKISVPDIDTYHDFIKNKLANLPNIGNVQSYFVMSTIKEE
jgi:Lrp/AsnC family transcriptional regulator, leucine-responsive regulatory protein